jgi:HK97 family phage portal protein
VPKAAAVTAQPVSTRVSYGFGFAGGYGMAHEPFSGAWQRNITNASPRDPNLLAFSAVYACVTIISQDIAKLPLRVMKLLADGITEVINKLSPYDRLLRKPNDYQSRIEFMQLYQACRLIRGNVYVFKEFDQRGVPVKFHLLHPDRVQVLVEPVSKEVYYRYTPYGQDMTLGMDRLGMLDGTITIPSRYVIHDRINCLWHPLIGTSPLFAAAVTSMTGARILMNSESLFANMARPAGVLSAPATISDITAERLKREFEANYSAGNIGKTAVLGDGLNWQPMVMTSTDAQLIEQLKWTIEDVARAFRVPMYLLADLAKMTYKNNEQAQQAYYQGCLQYHIESTEVKLTNDFDMDEDIEYVAFNTRVMFRMDMSERFAAYKEGIMAGVLAPNEARAWENLGPVEGGKEPRMQMQMVPLSTPVAPPAAPASAPAPAPKPEDADTDPPEDDEPTEEERAASRLEMINIMQRVSAGAARAKFAFEDRDYGH